MRQVFAPQTALAERSSAPSANPYHILNPIRTLRKELGLTSNDLVVLQALISFIPKKDGQVSPRLSIVFPSNAALSERTNGLDERTIRRCIGRLVVAELIRRRDSATRKRFPLRYGGVIRDAFGFNLAPLFEREAEFMARAERTLQDQERLRSLRAEALALRVKALQQAPNEEAVNFLQGVRNALRRATVKLQDIIDLIEQMVHMIGMEAPRLETLIENNQNQTETTDCLSGGDGQNVRHVESKRLSIQKEGQGEHDHPKSKPAKQDPKSMEWRDFKHLAAFYPEEPRDTQATLRIITNTGSLLRMDTGMLMEHLKSKGPGKLLLTLDYLLGKAEYIKNPARYFDKMMMEPV